MLHNASLLYENRSISVQRHLADHLSRLDDFQDNSPLRRGRPSAHTIFGAPQAVNSSSMMVVKAILKVHDCLGPACSSDAMGKHGMNYQGLLWVSRLN